jgi:predicted nucleic acid-binding protein
MPLISRGFALQGSYQLSYWDALIVAAAESGGCAEILSEDLDDGAIYAGVMVRNPFRDLG